jgi:hypothetical protein
MNSRQNGAGTHLARLSFKQYVPICLLILSLGSAPALAQMKMGKAKPGDPNAPPPPPLKQLTKLAIDRPLGEQGYVFRFRTDVPAFSGLRLSARPPVWRGDSYDFDRNLYQTSNLAGVSTPSASHVFKVPYSRLHQDHKYYYLIEALTTGRGKLQIYGDFHAQLPQRID